MDAFGFFDELVINEEVAAESRVGGFGAEVVNDGAVALSVAVDASIALFDGGWRPRNIEVDEVMAGIVEVDAFGCNIGGQQQPDLFILSSKAVDDGHLFMVRHAAIEDGELLIAEFERLAEVVLEAIEGDFAFNKDDGADGGARPYPDAGEGFGELAHFGWRVVDEGFDVLLDVL